MLYCHSSLICVSPPITAHKNGKHVRIRGISCGSYLKTCKGEKKSALQLEVSNLPPLNHRVIG